MASMGFALLREMLTPWNREPRRSNEKESQHATTSQQDFRERPGGVVSRLDAGDRPDPKATPWAVPNDDYV